MTIAGYYLEPDRAVNPDESGWNTGSGDPYCGLASVQDGSEGVAVTNSEGVAVTNSEGVAVTNSDGETVYYVCVDTPETHVIQVVGSAVGGL